MLRTAFLLAVSAVTTGAQETDFRQQALEAVAERLSEEGLAPEDFVLEVRGEPVLYPDHERWHARDNSRPAQVVGIVKDETGAVIPGCELTLVRGDEVVDVTVSGARGEFHFGGLGDGGYVVRAGLAGFKRSEVVFDLDSGMRREFELILEYGRMTEAISVRATSRGSVGVAGRGLPRALVLVLAAVGEEVRSFNVLLPVGSRRGVVSLLPERNRDHRPMTLQQWEFAVRSAAPFYEAATRFEDGPERFNPYIDTSRVGALLGGDYDEEALRRQVAFYLDATVLSVWLRFEGMELPSTTRETGMSEEEAMRLAGRNLAAARTRLTERLRAEGADNPGHREALLPYLRRYLGEGLVGRRDLEGEEVRVTRMLPWITLSFDFAGGQFRIVAMAIDD